MTGEHRAVPFRWILPITQLLLCIIMLWPVRYMLIREVRASVEAYRTHGRSLQNYPIPFNIHPSRTQPQVRIVDPNLLPPDMSKEHPELIPITLRLWGPALLNLPAGLAELPYSLAFDNGRFWTPEGMGLPTWRAISWPLIALILWWIAGRSTEALVAAFRGLLHPKITWIELIVGIGVLLMGAFALLAPIETDVRNDPELPWVFLSLAGALWVLLGSITVIARFAQSQMKRRQHANN
jgi:hypothetical protein